MTSIIKANTPSPDTKSGPNAVIPDILTFAVSDFELGKVLVARSTKGVCAILLGNDADGLAADLASRFQQSTLVHDETAVKGDFAEIKRYVASPSAGLKLTLDMRGTPFQRRVWEKLIETATGRTTTYLEMARGMTVASHPRAVAGACAANPIALAIPCHRVLRTDGTLAGYRWGLERKRILIEKEMAA